TRSCAATAASTTSRRCRRRSPPACNSTNTSSSSRDEDLDRARLRDLPARLRKRRAARETAARRHRFALRPGLPRQWRHAGVLLRPLRLLSLCLLLAPALVHAGGGPLGIDHRWSYDYSGIWKRSNQDLLRYGALATDIGLALWEGDGSRLGRAAWQSVDSVVLAGVTAESAKRVFGRERPRDTNDPNQWFKSGGRSFPSGEVAEISSIITPYVLEYRHDHPAVWALELLPAYD